MYIVDCHCDTLTELYKKDLSLYSNDQHFDVKRMIELGGGLQFCAIFVPTHEFRYYGGLRYTMCLLDKYIQEIKKMQADGVDVLFTFWLCKNIRINFVKYIALRFEFFRKD